MKRRKAVSNVIYANMEYYQNEYCGDEISVDDLRKYLKRASRDIDVLTYNRIMPVGFDNLTEFQQETIKDVACQHAEFLHENEEILDSIISSYSINGVALSFRDNWNLHMQSGVAMQKNVYMQLSQTGLTCRLLR